MSVQYKLRPTQSTASPAKKSAHYKQPIQHDVLQGNDKDRRDTSTNYKQSIQQEVLKGNDKEEATL